MKIGSELGTVEYIHDFTQFDLVTHFLARHDLFFYMGSSFYQDKHSDIVS